MKSIRACICLITALAAALAWCSPADAHGGGVVVPIIVPMPATLPAAQTGGYDRIHTVAVLPALGDTMQLQNVHFMGTKAKSFPIAGWNLDGLAGSLLQKYLSSRFTVKTVDYDRAAIAALPNGQFQNSRVQLTKILGAIPSGGIDAFVVLRPDLEYQAPGVEGLALVNGNGMGDPPPIIWANYEIDLIDAHTYNIIAKSYSRVTYRMGEAAGFASVIAPNVLKLDDNLTPDAAQTAILRIYATHLLDASIVETLRSLSMGLRLPAPGDRTLVPIPADKKPYPAVKSVAIVSAMGDHLDLEHSGMFFAHDSYSVPISDWHMDDAVTKVITANLDKRFTVKPAPADMSRPGPSGVPDAVGKSSPVFPGLATSQDVDIYIVVSQTNLPCPVGQHSCSGLGVVNFTPMGNAVTGVFANYTMAVIDAHTLKWLAWQQGVMPPSFPSFHPYDTLPDAAWPAKPPALTTDQLSTIHASLDNVIQQSIPESMMALGLTGMMVQPDVPPAQTGVPAPKAPASASP